MADGLDAVTMLITARQISNPRFAELIVDLLPPDDLARLEEGGHTLPEQAWIE